VRTLDEIAGGRRRGAGCGGGAPSPSITATAADKGAVLVVVADKDYQDRELDWTRAGLANAGYAVQIADVGGTTATGVGGGSVTPYLTVAEAHAADYVAVVIVGGPGIAATYAGVLHGRSGTAYGSQREAPKQAGCTLDDAHVVVDGRIVTADGPEAAQAFGEALVEVLGRQ
jgi:protease I